jgi:hypothetical protein
MDDANNVETSFAQKPRQGGDREVPEVRRRVDLSPALSL